MTEPARRPGALHGEGTLVWGRDTGLWIFVTASGAGYLLDLDEHTCTRTTGTESHAIAPFGLSKLRRDGETIPLYGFSPLNVGRGDHLLVGDLSDEDGYIGTGRHTTPVVSITQAA